MKKEYYELKKVVDPHRHMTKAVRDHLFDGMRLRDDSINNDTFLNWTVGSEKEEYDLAKELEHEEEYASDPDNLEYEEDYDEDELDEKEGYEQSLFHLSKVDEFLLKHFKKGEEIIVLFWW